MARAASAALSVAATGTGPLFFHWYQGNSGDTSTPVGGDANTLITPPLSATTGYWVRVSNTCGHVDSTSVTITVECKPRRHLIAA